MVEWELTDEWASEEIPDSDRIFMRVHKTFLKDDGSPAPGVFRDHGDAMSTDWEKYRTPNETRGAAKIPADNGVVSLVVGSVRLVSCPQQTVSHTPNLELDNRSHTDVAGEKTTEARVKLRRLAKWEKVVS